MQTSSANTPSKIQVQSEATPNPATMKFNLGFQFQDEGFDCPNVEESYRSPLAQKIFGFPWTSSIYFGTDYITITKQDWVDWQVLAKPLTGLIQEHLDSGEALIALNAAPSDADEMDSANDSEIVKQIKAVIRNEIKPVVALDGGDVSFFKYENNILQIQMKGSCAGCPSSAATLKDGIEVRMKQAFPEIIEVVGV